MTAHISVSEAVEHQPRYAWLVMAMLWGMDLMTTMVFFSIGVLLPIWTEDLGLTPMQAGLLGSAGFLGFGIMALPAAIWLTRYNPRNVTLVCAIGMAILILLQAGAPTVELLLIGRFAFVLLVVSRLQVQVIFMHRWFQPRLYSTLNSLDFGTRAAGQILALSATPVLILLLGSWRSFYLGIAAGMVALAFVWAFLGREPQQPQRNSETIAMVGNPAGVLRRHKVLWLVAGSQIGAAVAFAAFISFYPSYAIDRLGISLTTIGLLMGLFPLGMTLGSLSSGPISQAIGRRKPFVWVPGLLLPVLYTALLRVDAVPLIMLLLLGSGFCAMMVTPILATIPFDLRLDSREVSVALGLMRTLFPVGATLGPLLVGFLQEVTGSLFLGLSIAAPMAITLFFAGVLLPETGPKGRHYLAMRE